MSNDIKRNHPSQWKYKSPDTPGFHEVISPENSPCKSTWIYRLNLLKGKNHIISNKTLELSSLIIEGEIECIFKNKKEVLSKKGRFLYSFKYRSRSQIYKRCRYLHRRSENTKMQVNFSFSNLIRLFP